MAENYPEHLSTNGIRPEKNDNFTGHPDFTVKTSRQKADKYNKEKYTVENHMYPSDLMGGDNNGVNSYGGHYVIFYINVSTESKLIKTNQVETVGEIEPRVRGELVGKNYSSGAAIAASGVADLATGVALGGVYTSVVGINYASRLLSGVAGAAGLAVLVGGKLAAVNETSNGKTLIDKVSNSGELGSFTRPQKRLKQTIALHIPHNLHVNYGVNWGEEAAFGLTAVMDMGKAATEAFSKHSGDESNSWTDNAVSNTAADVASNSSSIIAALSLRNTLFKSAISAGTGVAVNPKKEQVFDNVKFRTFSFSYEFFPRSIEEAKNIQNIIKQFKLHMHPEFKDAKNFLYLYPSEFDIKYYKDGEENLNIHRHTSCVLTDMDVNYTPNGNFTTFSNGMPTQINMILNFRELALLTKEKIEDNY